MRGVVLGATYAIPLASLTTQELTAEKERLTLRPRQTFGPPVPPVCAWEERGGALHIPRFYGLQRFGPAETDLRTEGDAFQTEMKFTGTLTPVQERVSEALSAGPLSSKGPHGAIVCLPCGYGKTVWGVHFVCAMKRKACILVHKAVIRDQWKATFERFCPEIRVGIVQGSKWETDADVVIAMVLTVARQAEDPPTVFDSFGVVIADEAHHYAAPVMNRSMRLFRARWIVGLTATKERPDGLTPLLHWCMGPEGFRVQRDGGERVRVSVALFRGAAKEILSRDGKPLASIMVNCIATHSGRNAFLAQRIVAMRLDGRVILVLSDRLAQLRTLRDLVLASEFRRKIWGSLWDPPRSRSAKRSSPSLWFSAATRWPMKGWTRRRRTWW